MPGHTYQSIYDGWLANPQGFWAEAAEAIHWQRRWDRVLDDSHKPLYSWFAGGRMNTCYNTLDRHVEEGRGEQRALIHDSPVTDSMTTYTYRELRDLVAAFAGALRFKGVARGDRVIIYMPMVPEVVIAMLACARLGAIHSVVFGGFAAKELASRIEDATPKLIVSASCGVESNHVIEYKPLLDRALAQTRHKPGACIILQRPQCQAQLLPRRDYDWRDVVEGASPTECVPVAAPDPLYILYTSGTTGQPKGVVRDNGGHSVALKWSMKNIYGVEPGDVYWSASDVGWVVGQSYIVYGPLLQGCTTIMYEGKPVGTPDAGAFWRVISQHGVKVMFTAPTAFRAIKKEDPQGQHVERYDLSKFRALFLAGERCDADTLNWAQTLLKTPVIDHWWQTETGWAITANCLGIEQLPVKPGSPTKAVPGYDIRILSPKGDEMPSGEMGNICIKLPLAPGCLPTLWHNDQRYQDAYLKRYPGYYLTGDAGYRDQDGYFWVMSRIDDVINVAGHRLSTGAVEEVLASHPDVAECAVIGAADPVKGQQPLGLVVLKAGAQRDHAEIAQDLVRRVREQIGPVCAFKLCAVVQRLPKTRSGKCLRGVMSKIADGQPYNPPATIDDPAVLEEIAASLNKLGFPQQPQEPPQVV